MSDSSPWDEIAVPGTDFNVRQIPGIIAAPSFWGRDSSGAYLLIIELKGDHTACYRRDVSTVNGIGVDLRAGAEGQQRLVLTLEKQVDRDLFEGLCRTLISALVHANDSASAVAVSLAHVRRWKTFLSGRGTHLSPEEVRGLFAELTFLLEVLDRMTSTAAAIESWLGSENSQQDFIFGNVAIEIKSLSGVERNAVRISSEDQLESLQDALFLRIYRLSILPEASHAQSLNEIVAVVHERLGNSEGIENFDKKLVKRGYAPLPEYDEPRFAVSDVRSFYVSGEFPRLIRSSLPVGLAKVAYDIKLEAIARFERGNDTVFGAN